MGKRHDPERFKSFDVMLPQGARSRFDKMVRAMDEADDLVPDDALTGNSEDLRQLLIRQCHPAIVAGEQVARKAGREWLAVVRSDLETTGYAFGAADLPACAVGAWHERPRHYWAAHSLRVQQRREKPCSRTIGRMGRLIESVSWDRGWEKALRDFRGMDDGLSYGVGITDGFRNAIVPPLAQAFIEAIM